MPGPPPSPNARRRNDRDAWRTLAQTCTLPAPDWPLTRRPRGHADLWAHLWSLPVAAIWHEQGAARLVARYVLVELEAERDPSDTRLAAEARQIEDRLLISPSTRIRARILIESDAGATAELTAGVADLDAARRARLAAG